MPQTPNIAYRSDVLYYENTDFGHERAKEVLDVFGGRQEIAIVDHKLPAATHPVTVFRVQPEYPIELRVRGISGEVLVEFIVGETGEVIEAVVVRSTMSALNDLAVAAVRKWKFKAAERSGRPIRAVMQIPMTFGVSP